VRDARGAPPESERARTQAYHAATLHAHAADARRRISRWRLHEIPPGLIEGVAGYYKAMVQRAPEEERFYEL